MKRKNLTRISILLACLFLTSLACQAITQPFSRPTPALVPSLPGEGTETTEVTPSEAAETQSPEIEPTQEGVPSPTAPEVQISAEELYPPSFADYPAVTVKLPDRSPAKLTLPVDVNSLTNLAALEVSDQQRSLLAKNGFAVAAPKPGEYREFYQVYEAFRYADTQPLFVTTDAIFHVYHLIFDKMLRDLEREQFSPTLGELTSSMLAASLDQLQSLAGTPLEEPARRNVAFFAVAAQLLGLPEPVPAEVYRPGRSRIEPDRPAPGCRGFSGLGPAGPARRQETDRGLRPVRPARPLHAQRRAEKLFQSHDVVRPAVLPAEGRFRNPPGAAARPGPALDDDPIRQTGLRAVGIDLRSDRLYRGENR